MDRRISVSVFTLLIMAAAHAQDSGSLFVSRPGCPCSRSVRAECSIPQSITLLPESVTWAGVPSVISQRLVPNIDRPEAALERPTQQSRTDGKACADRGQHDQTSLLQASFFHCGVHGQRNRCRRGVAVTVNIYDYALGLQSQAVCGGTDNAQVCLMGDEGVDIRTSETVPFEKL